MESYKIENLTFEYPSSESYALNDISVTIQCGEFITVCGPSGCGKSTFLRALKPVISPEGKKGGSIFFEGKELSSLTLEEQARKIGFVMQSPDNQIVTDKVWHELAFGLESLGMKNEEIRMRVAEMAAFFGIEEWFHKKTNELSGGQKQLLNLAAVMVMQPSVLILDEPTSQLDPIAAQEFLTAVSKINRELGVTVILSEHRLEEALAYTDRMIVMKRGSIAFCGKSGDAIEFLNGEHHGMISAMPVAMRVYSALEKNGKCPVTVKEGRDYLLNFVKNQDIHKVEKCTFSAREEVALEIKGAYFRYEKESPDIIKALNLKVYKGELYAILGGNGSGKTTALSLISGINKPYRGEIRGISDFSEVGILPQNPRTVFVEKTVEKDIYEMLSDCSYSKEEKRRLFDEVVELCDLKEQLHRHPYDLSGGEMQRAAFAKVLLRKPKILLLDEPTKGMDAQYKLKFAEILRSLCSEGVTVVMVSHDTEFCAKFADRCAMFFDGGIVSENTPSLFFSGNSFYTTAANRMARGIIEGAVTDTDIISACGGKTEGDISVRKNNVYEKDVIVKEKEVKKINVFKIIFGILFAILGVLLIKYYSKAFSDWRMYAVDLGILLSFALAFNYLVPQKKLISDDIEEAPRKKQKTTLSFIAGILTVLIIMPLTALSGIYLFDDRKYYFISLLLIIEAMLPFIFSFESRKTSPRKIVVIAVLCAIGVAGRIAFFMIPQFKPIAAVIIITGICFGAEAGFLTGAVSAFVSNFYFSQGPHTPWQMFGFAAVGFFAGLLFRTGILRKTRGSLTVFGILVIVLVYGPLADLSALSYVAAPTAEYMLTTFAMGLPFNFIHGASTAFFLYTCAPAMIEKLERIRQKYGIR